MDDEGFDNDSEFDDDFFGEDDIGTDAVGLSRSADMGAREGMLGESGGEALASMAVVPPEIENVQVYLPNVQPTAFPVIVSVLAQATIGVGIDLPKLSCATRNVEYQPLGRVAAATMRLHEPTAVVLIRNSGSLIILGAASISEARQAAELAARIIRKALNLQFTTFRFRVRSMMARFNACSPVRLDELARHSLEDLFIPGVGAVAGSYEPERFSACSLRIMGSDAQNQWSVTCSVYVTGKITILGARSIEEVRFAFDALVPILHKYLAPTAVR